MMKIRALSLLIVAASLLAACGSTGTNTNTISGTGSGKTGSTPEFEIKFDGKDVPMEIKSGWQKGNDYSEFAQPGGKPTLTTGLQEFALRNYEYDPKKNYGVIKMANEKLTAPGQILVSIVLWDEKGTTDRTTPLKVGTYASDHKDSMSLSAVTIYMYGEGKDQIEGGSFSGGTPNKGEVKITSVANDTATGEIDVNIKSPSGKDVTVKGKFTAKMYKP
jgi:major membrane immunogen (membrane-anchored lipoprotein)